MSFHKPVQRMPYPWRIVIIPEPIHRRLLRVLSIMAVFSAVGLGPRAAHAQHMSIAEPTATVRGSATTWRIALGKILSFSRVPHTSWAGYKDNVWRFLVIHLQATNVGKRTADPYQDLALVLKVLPGYPTKNLSGWEPLERPGFTTLMTTAAHEFGGVVPWQVISPGNTAVYVFVFGTWQHEGHYAMYGGAPYQAAIKLFNLGV